MTSADLTRRELSLGARDTYTGLCDKDWAETTIQGSIQEAGSAQLPGYICRYPINGFIPDVIRVGDEIKDAGNQYYLVKSARQVWWLDQFDGYLCNLVKLDPHVDRAATSGTWHTDPDAIVSDSRYRAKKWLDDNWGGITLDAGGAADVKFMFPTDYPILYELKSDWKDNDVIGIIDKVSWAPSQYNFLDKVIQFRETISINVYAINKTGSTAVNLIDKLEEEIRHIATDHSSSTESKRKVSRIDNKPLDEGGTLIYNSTLTIEYTRVNDDYTPTVPTITWGPSAAPTGTFTFPNVLSKRERYVANDVFMAMPARSGSFPQVLGTESLVIELTCDLDLEYTSLTWKRAQAGAKTDQSNWQVFQDIWHEGGESEAYQTLTLEWGSFPVRMEEPVVSQDGDGRNTLTVTFIEYNASTANTDYRHRLGITH